MNDIDFVWEGNKEEVKKDPDDVKWRKAYTLLCQYRQKYKNVNVPRTILQSLSNLEDGLTTKGNSRKRINCHLSLSNY